MLEDLDELINKYPKRIFAAGSTILYQGEVPRSACILMSGSVRVLNISPQGDYQIVTFHIAGEFFPSSWIFGKTTSTLFFYEATSDCEVVFCPRNIFIEHMLGKPERMHALLDYFTSNYSASLIRINALEQSKAREKLLFTLYYLCQRYAKPNGDKLVIPISLTHQDFGNLVGLTRETTAVEMNILKKQGAVSYSGQKYIVNVKKVLELIGEESFKDLRINL